MVWRDKIAQNHQITKNIDAALFAMKTTSY